LGDAERSLLNLEFVALRNEIDRVSANTNFNGTTLLNGGDVVATQTERQTGYLAGKGIAISVNTAVTSADSVFRVSYDYTNAATDTGMLTVVNQTTGETQSIDINALITAKRAQPAAGDLTNNLNAGDTVDVNFNALGVTLKLDSRFDVDTDLAVTPPVTSRATTGTIGGTPAGLFYNTAGLTGAQLGAMSTLDAVTGKLAISVTYTANSMAVNATAGLEFSRDGVTWATTLATAATNTAGAGFYVRGAGSGGAFARVDLSTTTTTAGAGFVDVDVSGLFRNVESVGATKSFTFKVGTGTTAFDDVGFTLNGVSATQLGIGSATVDTAANASAAINLLNTAITTVAARRAEIGAAQSRLDFASANISTAIENITAATSALLDVDVSAEITAFTSQQVLVQAGVSLLAQANQQPSLLLRLLQ
jgi:flagellin-like hook-associated protein FlgL